MPADLEISIQGVDRLVAKFGRVQSIKILEPPMWRAVYRLQRTMATYPPPPPKSKYRRTGTYGRKWTVKVEGDNGSLTGKVGILLSYAPWVGSALFQARIHRGRWATDQQAVQIHRPAIVKDFNSAIKAAIA